MSRTIIAYPLMAAAGVIASITSRLLEFGTVERYFFGAGILTICVVATLTWFVVSNYNHKSFVSRHKLWDSNSHSILTPVLVAASLVVTGDIAIYHGLVATSITAAVFLMTPALFLAASSRIMAKTESILVRASQAHFEATLELIGAQTDQILAEREMSRAKDNLADIADRNVHIRRGVAGWDLKPDNAYMLGFLLDDQGDHASARLLWRQAADTWRLDDEHGDADAPIHLGNIYVKCGDFLAAREAWERATKRGNKDGFLYLGALLANQGDVEGAREAFKHWRKPRAARHLYSRLRALNLSNR